MNCWQQRRGPAYGHETPTVGTTNASRRPELRGLTMVTELRGGAVRSRSLAWQGRLAGWLAGEDHHAVRGCRTCRSRVIGDAQGPAHPVVYLRDVQV